jgi:hypothetical protein
MTPNYVFVFKNIRNEIDTKKSVLNFKKEKHTTDLWWVGKTVRNVSMVDVGSTPTFSTIKKRGSIREVPE